MAAAGRVADVVPTLRRRAESFIDDYATHLTQMVDQLHDVLPSPRAAASSNNALGLGDPRRSCERYEVMAELTRDQATRVISARLNDTLSAIVLLADERTLLHSRNEFTRQVDRAELMRVLGRTRRLSSSTRGNFFEVHDGVGRLEWRAAGMSGVESADTPELRGATPISKTGGEDSIPSSGA